MKLPHTEVKFYPKVKSQTSLSSLRVSCKRALKTMKSTINKLKKSGIKHKPKAVLHQVSQELVAPHHLVSSQKIIIKQVTQEI